MWTIQVLSDQSKSASTSDNLSLESWSSSFEISQLVVLESSVSLIVVFLATLHDSQLDDPSSVDLSLKNRSLSLKILESINVC
jgi:hypothetical protein